MKLRLLALLTISSFTTYAQIRVVKLDKTAIPKSIVYKGYVVDAVKYTDAVGEHIVITTETGETPSKKRRRLSRRCTICLSLHN